MNKNTLTKEERTARNADIIKRVKHGETIISIKTLYKLKSTKSIYAIIYPDKYNEKQRIRRAKAKSKTL